MKDHFTLTLREQGILLVSVLILLELIFVSNLYFLLNQAEREARSEQRGKEILGKTNTLVQTVYDGAEDFKQYAINNRDPVYLDKYDQAVSRMREILQYLKSEAQGDPEVSGVLANVDAGIEEGIKTFADIREVFETKSMLEAFQYGTRRRAEYQPTFDKLTHEMLALVEDQKKLVDKSPRLQQEARNRLKGVLLFGVVANVLFALFLAIVFTRRITSRLEILVDNTTRLRTGQLLNRPISGKDEIAQLDADFHGMAEALRREKELLKASEARVRAIVDEMPVGLVTFSRGGRVDFMNPAAQSMFQTSVSPAVHKPIESLFQATGKEKASDLLEKLHSKSDSRGKIVELTAIRSNGEQFPVEVALAKIQMAGRELAIVLDISEKYEIQRIRQAFVAMVSHELRTPLTSIGGFLTLLEMGNFGAVPDEALHQAKRAEVNVNRLIGLINELLDLEKLESGSISVTRSPCELGMVFEQCLGAVGMFAEDRGIKLEIPAACRIEVIADPDRLVQVLVNLISNAVKFSETGQTVRVSVEEQPDWLEFKVVDSGRGIPAKHLASIFERFQQVEVTDSKKKGGTGLGLAICKAIVELHGGTIGVESAEGKGSTFWFRLPYANSLEDEEISAPGLSAATTFEQITR